MFRCLILKDDRGVGWVQGVLSRLPAGAGLMR